MPTIPNFPSDLLDQHHHWHSPSSHPEQGVGRVHAQGTAGGGIEFLTFHRNFQAQVLSWYNTTNFTQAPFNNAATKASLVTAWTAVPAELQADGDWPNWSADATRLQTMSPDFATADELGTFIEAGIHNNFLHGAAASAFNESVVSTFHSPQSTLFYKIHGLVDHWWSRWQIRHKRWVKELVKELAAEVVQIDRIKALVDIRQKHTIPEIKDRIADVKLVAFDVPDDPRNHILPEVLAERLGRIERRVFPNALRTFIRDDERPKVGPPVFKDDPKGHGDH